MLQTMGGKEIVVFIECELESKVGFSRGRFGQRKGSGSRWGGVVCF